jgi:tetratricopeptide (TPR) repeat protein
VRKKTAESFPGRRGRLAYLTWHTTATLINRPAVMRPGLIFLVLALVCTAELEAHLETPAERAALDALIRVEPGNADHYLRRAADREAHGEWETAEADLRRAMALVPDSAAVRLALGRIAFARRKFSTAREQLDAVLAREPRLAEAFIWRARARARLSDAVAAQADYSTALALIAEPSPDLFLERAELPVDGLAALAGLDEGIARIGPAIPLVERAIALELKLGRTAQALARIDRVAATSERKEAWLKRRGDVLAAAGRTDEAHNAYAAALAAIATLPAWLRENPDTLRLAAELKQLTRTHS